MSNEFKVGLTAEISSITPYRTRRVLDLLLITYYSLLITHLKMLDKTKPVILKQDLIDTNRNWYQKGSILQPGALPEKWLLPQYCENVVVAPTEFSPIAGANVEVEIQLEADTAKLGQVIDYDKLNLNSATIDQIIGVEGFTTSAATKIVANRDANGAFESAKQLIDRLPALAKFENLLNERFNFNKAG